jgi:Flp pilus assembly protein TadG
MIMKIREMINNVRKAAGRFSHNDSGVAALEFALIAPLLITLYLGTLEISGGLQMNKKVGRAASTAADLIAQFQENELKVADLDQILRIGKAVTQPYALTEPTIIATGIKIDTSGTPKILWSRKVTGSGAGTAAYAKGITVAVPTSLQIAGTFLVKVEATIEYRTLTSWTVSRAAGQTYGTIDMSETYYQRPRNTSGDVDCTGC